MKVTTLFILLTIFGLNSIVNADSDPSKRELKKGEAGKKDGGHKKSNGGHKKDQKSSDGSSNENGGSSSSGSGSGSTSSSSGSGSGSSSTSSSSGSGSTSSSSGSGSEESNYSWSSSNYAEGGNDADADANDGGNGGGGNSWFSWGSDGDRGQNSGGAGSKWYTKEGGSFPWGLVGFASVVIAGGFYTYKMVKSAEGESEGVNEYKLADYDGIELPPTMIAAIPKPKEEKEVNFAAGVKSAEVDCFACCHPKVKGDPGSAQALKRREASAVKAVPPPTTVVDSKCGRCCKPKVKSPKVAPNAAGALV